MEFREATASDTEVLRSMARESVKASYASFLDEETIDDALAQWYGGDATRDLVESEDSVVLLAVDDGRPVGFSQSEIVGDRETAGHIHWLHVRPDERGAGLGSRLLTRTREALLDEGAEGVRGFVLAGNEDGNRFYDEHGFERAGTRSIRIGDETHTENVYVESDVADAEWRAIEARELADGTTAYVSYGEAARGSQAPFYAAYESTDEDERYGWFCGNCDTLDNAMDSMGRIACNVCGNKRKATRWDASYL
ncbi:GNAT family N-acetyltransferase [Halovivax limisalsi]|uniref:GNAT family N-acetyltransferase n=1 Tax=Halovivax limisalsi TaxID=1453760 RepID=UPI001FFD6AE0|nr:GNAT family N-acetyltransferase [Halovivax limisalsi]